MRGANAATRLVMHARSMRSRHESSPFVRRGVARDGLVTVRIYGGVELTDFVGRQRTADDQVPVQVEEELLVIREA